MLVLCLPDNGYAFVTFLFIIQWLYKLSNCYYMAQQVAVIQTYVTYSSSFRELTNKRHACLLSVYIGVKAVSSVSEIVPEDMRYVYLSQYRQCLISAENLRPNVMIS